MPYYIKYTKSGNKATVAEKRPSKSSKTVGFAEGPFKTVESVKRRLNMMDIPSTKRPAKFR